MMQQVATSNSDIAAFAVNTTQSSQQDPTSAQDFGKMLQQHQDARQPSEQTKKASGQPVSGAKNGEPNKADHAPNNLTDHANITAAKTGNAELASGNKTLDTQPAMPKEAGAKTQQLESAVTTTDVAGDELNNAANSHTCSQGCEHGQPVVTGEPVSEVNLQDLTLSDINELSRLFDLADVNSQITDTGRNILEPLADKHLAEIKAVKNQHQDWFSLVEKLQTQAPGTSESTQANSAGSKPIVVDAAGLIQPIPGDEVISVAADATNLLDVQADGSQSVAKFDPSQFSGVSPLAGVVAQILSKIDAAQLEKGTTQAEVQIEGLLNKLAELQTLFETSKTAANVGQGTEQNVTDVAAVKKVPQQLANISGISATETTTEQLTDKLNKTLIATVIAPASTGKEHGQQDPVKSSAVAASQISTFSAGKEDVLDVSVKHSAGVANQISPVGSGKENVSGDPLKLPLATSQPQALLGLDSEVAIAEVQDLPQEIVASTSGLKNNPTGNPLGVLANMSGEKLDKTLDNLLQRLATELSSTEDQKGRVTSQQAAAAAMLQADIPALTTNKELIAALKAGVDEFKAQVAQGREPGIDLKTLVAEAMSKSTDASVANNKQPEQIAVAVKAFSQVLDFAQQLNRALEQHQTANLSHAENVVREVGQGQFEQLKQFQTQSSLFDRAVNINKPEGHQQLAEKVRWMVNAKQMVAEIRLDPAELGSVMVKVSVTGEAANISFVVQSLQAKEAMESATPKLREMLAEKGIELGQSSVRQEQGEAEGDSKKQLAGGKNSHAEPGFEDSNEHPKDAFIQQSIVNGALGGIDFFV